MKSPVPLNPCKFLMVTVIIALLMIISPASADTIHALTVPAGKYPLPPLQVNDSMEPVILNQELSTVNDTGIYVIPAGSIILMSDDGINRVFDANGTQFLAVYDTGAHHTHTVPNGAFVDSEGNITYILSGNQLVMTIIDATATGIAQPTPQTVTASFSPMSATQGDAPLKVTFSDYSQGAITDWNWSFGDGSLSSERSPVHTYRANGTYNVTLAVSGPSGHNTFTYPDCITVGPLPPLARIGVDPQRADYAPLTVILTDTSMGDITGWSWDFGDGSTSTEQNPVHTYSKTGNYSVLLTVTGPAGKNTLEEPVFILVGPFEPVAYFEAIYTSQHAPCSVEFLQYSEGTITQWLWDFGDGTTSTQEKPFHTYLHDGNYTVNLTVTGPAGTSTRSRPSFIHVGEPFFIQADPVGIHSVGDTFAITGTTNLPLGEDLEYAVLTSTFNPGGPQFGNPSNQTGTTRVVRGNASNGSWSFVVDSAGFRPDEYLVNLHSSTYTDVEGNTLVTLVKGKYSAPAPSATPRQTPGEDVTEPVNVTPSPSGTHPVPLFPTQVLFSVPCAAVLFLAGNGRRG
ncbi:PKD domain-containing protein [Methanoregula sp.]|uniref:PKD domain-containing protein n=1 Tax=Methanoregula sp. TaxID=2052170 RepID=UPI00356ADEBA